MCSSFFAMCGVTEFTSFVTKLDSHSILVNSMRSMESVCYDKLPATLGGVGWDGVEWGGAGSVWNRLDDSGGKGG